MDDRLKDQIEAFGLWKANLIEQIDDYQKWLDAHELGSTEVDLRIIEILESLRSDRITIAFVAEVSSGKTELINAIFFSGYKRRLLPSEAGRTTMCPTELLHDDHAEHPYIRLLPIETRFTDMSIAEYRRNPIEWTSMTLDISSADSMADAFREVTRLKTVPVGEARRLGLYDDWLHGQDGLNDAPSEVLIPMWRHAIISFPHPLLKQGLVVLDTPGLNALGSEPELTLNMLPNAQAVLFLLAADTGVTKSELEMWQNHIRVYRSGHEKGLIVVLNKIDMLWDELKAHPEISESIRTQCSNTAEMLGIPVDNVFPVSAQKGLLARVKNDDVLLEKSGVVALERSLAEDILPVKHRIIRENIVSDISGMIESTRSIMHSRHEGSLQQFDELKTLCGKNTDVISHLMLKTREEQVIYNRNVEGLQSSRSILSRHARLLLDHLDMKSLDELVKKTRKSMSDSWTTHGLKLGMKVLFDELNREMKEASEQAEQTRAFIQGVFRTFHEEHGFADITPATFETGGYLDELNKLHAEAEAFRNNPMTTMTEQSYVIKKFFITLVSRARNTFYNARQEAERWIKMVLSPLITQIRDKKKQIERRLETLRKINESRDTLDSKIAELEQVCDSLKGEIETLEYMLSVINRPLTLDASEAAA